jgi:hypothetical protein
MALERQGKSVSGAVLTGVLAAGIGVTIIAACGDSYRVEPLLLESRQVAVKVIGSYDDKDAIARAEHAVFGFAEAYAQGRFPEAWDMLTTSYRGRLAQLAGGADEAFRQFSEGYRLEGEMLVQGDWTSVLPGPQPYYVTSPAPEAGKVDVGKAELFYVVQRDGTYRSFLLLREDGKARVEPL